MQPTSDSSYIETIKLLRRLSPGEVRAIADDFGQRAGLNIGFFDHLAGNSLDERISDLVNRAHQLDKVPELQTAIDNWRTAPKDRIKARGLMNRGMDFVRQGEQDVAIEAFSQAIAIAPDLDLVYTLRGQSYALTGQFEYAIADFDKAITLDPQDVEAYIGLATAYGAVQQFDKAFETYNKAIVSAPESAPSISSAYLGRAAGYLGRSNYDKALADFTKAAAFHDRMEPIALFNRAYTYRAKGDYAAARKDYERAAELGHPHAQEELAKLK